MAVRETSKNLSKALITWSQILFVNYFKFEKYNG